MGDADETLVIPRYCESHFDWAKTELKKEEDRHNKTKSDIVNELAQRLERSKRVPIHKIAGLIEQWGDKEGYVTGRYVRMVIDTKYKEVSKTTKASKEKREHQEELPHIERQVVTVTSDGKSTTEAEGSNAGPSSPQSDVVRELKKKLAEANQIIKVQKNIIDSTPKPGAKASGRVNIVSEAKAPEIRLSTEETKLRQKITELEQSLTPFEKNKTVDFADQSIPVIVFVNPRSRSVDVKVNEKLAQRMFR